LASGRQRNASVTPKPSKSGAALCLLLDKLFNLQIEPIAFERRCAQFDREASPKVANDRSLDPSQFVKVDNDTLADLPFGRAQDRDAASRNVDRAAIVFAPIGQHIAAAKRQYGAPMTAALGSFELV
jgi:hypothetical protein